MAEYIDRKDIDSLLRRLNEVVNDLDRLGVSNVSELIGQYYDQSDIDIVRNKLQNDLDNVDTSLTNLNDALVDFNAELINFDEDNTNLDEDLSKLKDNLLSFLDVLGLLDIDLNELSSTLTSLDTQLNGDSNTDGLVDTITALQYSIYGEPPYDSSNYSPSSLMGMLDTFGEQLGELSAGDNTLSLSLSTLSGYLTTFKGSLSELQTQIVSDYGQTIYNSLDSDLVKLVAAITQANDDLDAHQDLIDGVEQTIGTSSDTGNTTLYGKLYNTASTASAASTKATAVENTINNDLSPKVTTLKDTTIPAIKTKIGYDSIGNTSLQSQITATNGVVDGIDTAIGNTNNISGSIVSNINNVITGIGTAETNIGTLQTQMYGGGNNSFGSPSSTSVKGLIDSAQIEIATAQGDISDVQTDIGNVDVSNDGNLQNQIAWLVTELNNTIGYFKVVSTTTERDRLNPRFAQICYVTANGKFYEYIGDDFLGG